jgi:hypothetical protein
MSAPDFSMRESHASKRRVPAATIAAALRLRILSLPIGDGKNLAEARLAGNDGSRIPNSSPLWENPPKFPGGKQGKIQGELQKLVQKYRRYHQQTPIP